ncbi:DUF6769 family protein [Segatella bryantii]|uniref:DUF6769 family protein n=1 Tax=Segatella bryantii TaxID=77095 RepID=UPI0024304DD6|nr:DUF6769 family protein [Segatella bryantii]
MKKALYIYHLVLATFLMLLTTVIPHHHHDDEICIEVEHADHKAEHDSSCIKHMLTIQADDSVSRQTHVSVRFVPLYAFFRTLSRKALMQPAVRVTYAEVSAFYHSPQTRGFHSLRAPPL